MRQRIRSAAPLAALALLTGCGGSPSSHECTLRDAPAGISVEVRSELAHTVAEATLTACWDGACRKRSLHLREPGPEEALPPGDPALTTQSATAPESPGMRTPPPRTTEPFVLPGFALVPDLPEKPIRVTLVLRNQQGATVLDQRVSVTPEPTYPNGRSCSPGSPQARLAVTEGGALITR
ncbi:hypothetical protein [Streptomyces sp. TP-A0874]|uniref:hypothetical protein n=1 Tax=Streptomyces sp. TP-A0874 TaxID=549819 RepID=UPI0008532638|nr:hypothetical protein [Streptomyces sp. TP-A0874]